MADFRGHDKRMSVPQFGTWNGKTKDQTNYSMVFSQARTNRKKHKGELIEPQSLGNEKELLKQLQQNLYSTHAGKDKNGMPVPQFGAWDGKTSDQKSELVAPHSLGNDKEFLQQQQYNHYGTHVSMHDNKMYVSQSGSRVAKTKDQANYPRLLAQAQANWNNDKRELAVPRSLGNERKHLEQQLCTGNVCMRNNQMSAARNGKTEDQSNRNNHNIKPVVSPCSLGNERKLLEQQQHNDNGADADAGMHNFIMPLPQFGAWHGKTLDQTNYSVVFSQARANRKKFKNELIAPHAVGRERELLHQQQHFHGSYPVAHAGMRNHGEKKNTRKKKKKKSSSCFSCFSF